jgi:hypothetical protein
MPKVIGSLSPADRSCCDRRTANDAIGVVERRAQIAARNDGNADGVRLLAKYPDGIARKYRIDSKVKVARAFDKPDEDKSADEREAGDTKRRI